LSWPRWFFFFQAEDGIRDFHVTGVQTCALPILVLWLDFVASTPVSLNMTRPQQGEPLQPFCGALISASMPRAFISSHKVPEAMRSEERRVGKERRSRVSPCQ